MILTKENRHQFFYDVYTKQLRLKEIANKYQRRLDYVANIQYKIENLTHKPRIEKNDVVCFKCGKIYDLVIHHDHFDGELIAIVCQSCNIKISNNYIEYSKNIDYNNDNMVNIKIRSKTLEKLKLLNSGDIDKIIENYIIEVLEIKQLNWFFKYDKLLMKKKEIKKKIESHIEIIDLFNKFDKILEIIKLDPDLLKLRIILKDFKKLKNKININKKRTELTSYKIKKMLKEQLSKYKNKIVKIEENLNN